MALAILYVHIGILSLGQGATNLDTLAIVVSCKG